MFFKALSIAFLLLISLPLTATADNSHTCKYNDYEYIPHADYYSDRTPKNVRMLVQKNPDQEMSGKDVKAYHLFEIINPDTGGIESSIRIPLTCNDANVIYCQLDLQKSYITQQRMIDVGIIKKFSSGNMQKHVPYAIFMPGLTAGTQDPYKPSDFAPCCFSSDYIKFKYLPSLWISDRKISDCKEESE